MFTMLLPSIHCLLPSLLWAHVFSTLFTSSLGQIGCNGEDELNATLEKQYFNTPTNSSTNSEYPKSIVCRTYVTALEGQHILFQIESLQTEPQIFSACSDFLAIYEGRVESLDRSSANLLVILCGQVLDKQQILTKGNDATLRFQSDSFIEGKGGRISYQAIEKNECEPGWVEGPHEDCYRMSATEDVDFVTAQSRCLQQQSNLASIAKESDYEFIKSIFGRTHFKPWIGYFDAAVEGTLMYLDTKSLTIYPDSPRISDNSYQADCLYFDLTAGELNSTEYKMDRCQNKHPFICYKFKNGSSILISSPEALVKAGSTSSDVDYTYWLLIFVTCILFLILLCIICSACCKKKEQSRVGDVSGGSRAEARAPLAASNSEGQKTSTTVIVPPSHTNNQPPAEYRQAERPSTPPPAAASEHLVPVPVQRKLSKPHASTTRDEGSTEIMVPVALQHTSQSARQLPPLPLRETTFHSMNTREESFLRTRRGGELFERPKMAVLDSVSAISLDEFWSNDKK